MGDSWTWSSLKVLDTGFSAATVFVFVLVKDTRLDGLLRRKDGEVVGEVLELDEVKRTGTVNDVWSRIEFLDGNGTAQTGYIPTSCLDLPETVQTDSIDEELNAGGEPGAWRATEAPCSKSAYTGGELVITQ